MSLANLQDRELAAKEEARQNDEQLSWGIINNMLQDRNSLTRHQIDSFNSFLHVDLPEIFKRYNPIIVASKFDDTTGTFEKTCQVNFGQVYIGKPVIQENYHYSASDTTAGYRPLYPKEARLRNLNYSAPVYIDVNWTFKNLSDSSQDLTKTEERLLLFRLPIMVGSDACYLSGENDLNRDIYDDNTEIKGYFIVGGGEKVIVSQERHTDNKISVYGKANPPISYAEIKSSIDQRFYPIKVSRVILKPSSQLVVQVSGIKDGSKDPVPLFLLLRALEMPNDFEIYSAILEDLTDIPVNFTNILYESNMEARKILQAKHAETLDKKYEWHSQAFALYVLGHHYCKLKSDTGDDVDNYLTITRDFIHREILQHVGQNLYNKALFLCLMTKRVLDASHGLRPYDNRDHYANKRLNTAGYLMSQLFKAEFIRLTKSLKQNLLTFLRSTTKDNNLSLIITKHIRSSNIEQRFRYSLSTGNWSSNKISNSAKGISQVLGRISYLATISHLRRVQSPIDSSGQKITPPRHLHGTQFGYICANETPESGQVGMVKNLALGCQITVDCLDYKVRIALKQLEMIQLEAMDWSDLKTGVKVFINGEWLGLFPATGPKGIASAYENLKRIKRYGVINPFISIYWMIEWRELHIQTDGGRYVRPVFIVGKSGKLLIDEYFPVGSKERETFFKRLEPKDGSERIDWYSLISCAWYDKLKGQVDFRDANGQPLGNPGALIEYLDTNESETSLIAKDMEALRTRDPKYSFKYTHCEIHPMMMLGIVGGLIPYSDHNPAPRNCYQCLDENELVQMDNGSLKAIKDIKIGDKVVSVDPETRSTKITTVINQFVKETEKQILQIKTLSGRELTCTLDHPILTDNGWVEAGKLLPSSRIVTTSVQVHYPLDRSDLVLDKQTFTNLLLQHGMSQKRIDHHANQLEIFGLLPLFQDTSKIEILARIYGFLMADGSCGVYNGEPQIQLTFGMESSAHDFVKDVSNMGFGQNKVARVSGTVRGVIHQGYSVIYNNALASLIISLGATTGKKTIQPSGHLVPWIKVGSTLVKREFLAGFQGGDGSKIRFNQLKNRKSPNFILNTTSQTRDSANLESHLLYMNDVKNLFNEFGIVTKDIYTQKNDKFEDRFIIYLPFLCSRDNIINYFERIGYRYDNYKIRDSLPVYEYLKYQQFVTNKIDHIKSEIGRMIGEGKDFPTIGTVLGFKTQYVSDLARSLSRKSRMPNNNYITINEWMNRVVVSNNKFLEVPVLEITCKPQVRISDITVNDECHSFITGNGIVVHNSSMGKQAISIYSAGYNSRMDTNSHVLVYGHRPLCESRISRYIGMDTNPHGNQVFTAFLTYTGYNVEDSVIINQSAVERGLFNTLFYRSLKDEEKKHISNSLSSERFGFPPTYDREDPANRPIRDSTNGAPRLDSVALSDYNVIGKYTVDKNEQFLEAHCTAARKSEFGIIDEIFSEETHAKIGVEKGGEGGFIPNRSTDDNRLIKVRLSHFRKPFIGDKFAIRSAQKGTLGILYHASEMPHTAHGLIPDVIFNPHGMPTRMTVGTLLEMVLSRAAVLDGEQKDATPFTKLSNAPDRPEAKYYRTVDLPSYMDALEAKGIERHSNEVMYNGFTGEMMYIDVFMAPCFYQRLKHMTSDKYHSRESGPVQLLTRQPAEGRSRDGGLRCGEMERDVLIAYGASSFLKEKMLDSSDLFRMYVSKSHQTFCVGNERESFFKFNEQHLDADDVREIQLPYAMKLLWQEVTSMGIDMRLIVD